MDDGRWMMGLVVAAALLIGGVSAVADEPLSYAYLDPADVPAELRNDWPAEWEQQFRERADHSLRLLLEHKKGGTTWGESEKRLYPQAIAHVLAGDRGWGLKQLQSNDAEDIHRHTLGIDLYWCFTLKGQARKLFQFRDQLDPAYVERMLEAAQAWTEQDPLGRPHPQFGKGDRNKGGWGPQVKGSWVDVRDTDNLRMMRDTTVYLMAEAAGNEATRQLYKDKLAGFARMLYHVGQREWDSENYLGHSMAPLLNLYDFAEDPEVRGIAKACLDWMCAAAAVKYWKGAIGGPVLRDYGGAGVVFGAGLSHPAWLYFGDTTHADPDPHHDDVYHIVSAYRPPRAVVELARKRFDRPATLFATKPRYTYWEPGRFDEPRFYETTYFGKTFQMGSVVAAEPETTWDCNPFKLLIANADRGVDVFNANTTPLWGHAEKNPGDQIAQHENLLIWLRKGGGTFHFMAPRRLDIGEADGRWTLHFDDTTVTVLPVDLTLADRDAKPGGEKQADKVAERYPDERFLTAAAGDAAYSGFALVVTEGGKGPETVGLDVDHEAGRATLTADGKSLTLAYNPTDLIPHVEVNGQPRDLTAHKDVYRPADGSKTPIHQAWDSGRCRVEAGGWVWAGEITEAGAYRFADERSD